MRPAIDFHAVPAHQQAMHERLINWARWANGKGSDGRAMPGVSPMFRQYRSTDVWEAPAILAPVDGQDAVKIAKAVTGLPEMNRHAVSWFYVRPVNPSRAARALGLTLTLLAEAVIDARTMLRNRGA